MVDERNARLLLLDVWIQQSIAQSHDRIAFAPELLNAYVLFVHQGPDELNFKSWHGRSAVRAMNKVHLINPRLSSKHTDL